MGTGRTKAMPPPPIPRSFHLSYSALPGALPDGEFFCLSAAHRSAAVPLCSSSTACMPGKNLSMPLPLQCRPS